MRAVACTPEGSPVMPEETYASGDPLLAFDERLHVVSWNAALERLTGVPAAKVLGRPCWQLGGRGLDGVQICREACAVARRALAGAPPPTMTISLSGAGGRVLVTMSTIRADQGSGPRFVHVLSPLAVTGHEIDGGKNPLTPRQVDVLTLIAAGKPVKVVSAALGLAESTVRNHVRGILVRLGCHSQLEAVAVARQRGLLDAVLTVPLSEASSRRPGSPRPAQARLSEEP
jgi:DNA-binding CsgD family transcriptional regulator